jgi:hypothetical protein
MFGQLHSYCLSGAEMRQSQQMYERETFVACLPAWDPGALSAKVLQQHDVAFFVIELMVQNEFAIG